MTKPEITLFNPQTKDTKIIRLGYSFAMMLFGFFVPFFRRDWRTGLILMLLDIFSLGVISVIFAWFYNFYDVCRLVKQGYEIKKINGILPPDKMKKLRLLARMKNIKIFG